MATEARFCNLVVETTAISGNMFGKPSPFIGGGHDLDGLETHVPDVVVLYGCGGLAEPPDASVLEIA